MVAKKKRKPLSIVSKSAARIAANFRFGRRSKSENSLFVILPLVKIDIFSLLGNQLFSSKKTINT